MKFFGNVILFSALFFYLITILIRRLNNAKNLAKLRFALKSFTKINMVSKGMRVKISGDIKPTQELLIDPIYQKECVWYKYEFYLLMGVRSVEDWVSFNSNALVKVVDHNSEILLDTSNLKSYLDSTDNQGVLKSDIKHKALNFLTENNLIDQELSSAYDMTIRLRVSYLNQESSQSIVVIGDVQEILDKKLIIKSDLITPTFIYNQ